MIRRTAATARSRIGEVSVSLTSPTAPVSTMMFSQLVWRKDHGCWHCPIACKAILKAGEGEYKYAAGSRRPEYETAAAFGANCANSHTESISMANDICNRAGLDTISAGTVIGFAMELYENGILTKKDTDGIDLKWGNHQAMVAMTEKLAKREGLGDILADGVKIAAEKIGKGAEKFAVHIGGQELGMHDPKLPRAAVQHGGSPLPDGCYTRTSYCRLRTIEFSYAYRQFGWTVLSSARLAPETERATGWGFQCSNRLELLCGRSA